MAIQENDGSQDKKDNRPDGYLNIQIVDADGKSHSVPGNVGIALRAGSRIADALLKAAAENPDKEFTLTGRVNVVDKDAPPPQF